MSTVWLNWTAGLNQIVGFEWLVALRYLTAKRKQTVISVITIISVLGVAAGVAALIIAFSINNGFQSALQGTLLSATAHVTVVERNPAYGIEGWRPLVQLLRKIPDVVEVAPALYGQAALKGPLTGAGTTLKGIPDDDLGTAADADVVPSEMPQLRSLPRRWPKSLSGSSQILLGASLAKQLGVRDGNQVSLLSYQGQLTPLGMMPALYRFHVAGTFETGLFDFDSGWSICRLQTAQHVLGLTDVVNAIELRIRDIFKAPQVAATAEHFLPKQLIATTWTAQNRALLSALQLERVVSLVTVGLIELVAALNILVVLVTLVLEKGRDIAVLLSMGCRRIQIQRIFVLQGLMIGGAGCVLGLLAGYGVVFAGVRWHPLRLDEQVYALSYVPFESHWTDGAIVVAIALVTSFLASLQPSWSASRVIPAEALRYE